MKRQIALVLAAGSLLTLAACGKKEEAPAATAAPVTMPVMETTFPAFETQTEINWDILDTIQWDEDLSGVEETGETLGETLGESTDLYELPDKMTRLPEEEVVYATQSVNIRMEPTVNSRSDGKLKTGESCERIATSSDGWSAVIIREDLRYIASKYLTTKAPEGGAAATDLSKVTESAAGDVVYTNHWVRLRQGPGADTANLGTIPEGTKLQRIAICSNGWSKVNFNGTVGYVAGGYLSTTPPEAKPDNTTPPATTEGTTAAGEETTTAATDATTAATTESTAAKETTKATDGKGEEQKDQK